jgi:flagellar basal body-associated protein FliL
VTEDKGAEDAVDAVAAVDTDEEGDFEDTKTEKKKTAKFGIDLKNTMIMAVVALIAVGCAFMFVTRIYSSKDAYDAINVADISTVDAMTVDDTNKKIEAEIEKKEEAKKAESKSKEKEKKKGKGKKEKSDAGNVVKSNSLLGNIVVPMDSIVVNLGSVDSRRYLRVIVSLEVDNSETEKTIKENKIIFRDKLVSYLSTKDAKAIGSPDSQVMLRSEIKDILNELLGSKKAIRQVYFSDFIVQ